MKNSITFLAIIFTLTVRAQVQIPIRTDNVKDVLTLIDSVSNVTKYQFVKVDSTYDRPELLGFKLANKSDTVTMLFIRQIEGGNSDLKTKGNMMYSFYQVQGNYQALFPIWKKYFNPTADLSMVANNRGDYARDYKPKYEGWYNKVVFVKQPTHWVIK